MAEVLSVNVGRGQPTAHSSAGLTAIDKRPVDGAVKLRKPETGSGVAGDTVCDPRFHGGPDRAVYAYDRADLDCWELELGRPLRCGYFGENLTTAGLDVTGALIGEQWRVGRDVVLEISMPRIPCRTFAAWLGEQGWLRTFIERGRPGALLRVLRPGTVTAGDPITSVFRPVHGITVGYTFEVATVSPQSLPQLLVADALSGELKRRATRVAQFPATRS